MTNPNGQSVPAILAATADIVLLLDDAGMIQQVTTGPTDPPKIDSTAWVGKRWADTVAPESRPLLVEMLREAAAGGTARRQVYHASADGSDIPVGYTTARFGTDGHRLVAVGQDLGGTWALERRLVEVQQALEREHLRSRQSSSRYRMILQEVGEPLLVVDASTGRVIETNPAAELLLDADARKLVGRPFPFGLDRAGESAVQEQLATLRVRGSVDPITVRLGPARREVRLAMTLWRQDDLQLFLVRVLVDGPATRSDHPPLGRLLDALPDAFVVTDGEGRIRTANRAFLDLVEIPIEHQVRGQPIHRWIGRPGAEVSAVLPLLRARGGIRLFGTLLKGERGGTCEVEISGGAVEDGLALVIRDVGQRITLGPSGARDLTRAVADLTALVGRVSLKQLVRDTADLVERHFIEAALAMTRENRTSAAEVLGVSRQSLYVKLRRLGPESPSGAGRGRRAGEPVNEKGKRRAHRRDG